MLVLQFVEDISYQDISDQDISYQDISDQEMERYLAENNAVNSGWIQGIRQR